MGSSPTPAQNPQLLPGDKAQLTPVSSGMRCTFLPCVGGAGGMQAPAARAPTPAWGPPHPPPQQAHSTPKHSPLSPSIPQPRFWSLPTKLHGC